MTSDPNAIVLAPEGVAGSLTALIERLQVGGIHIDVTDEVGYAAQLASRTPFAPPSVLDRRSVRIRSLSMSDSTSL